MKKLLIIAYLILGANSLFGQIPADSIKAIIKREVANKRSKSIIVGIIDVNGRQIFSEGRISDENPVLPDANTLYEIGSITKVFTTLLLADMSLKQQLNVNDPISKYLPKTVKTPVRNGEEISLLHLSTHRAGYPRFPYNVDPKNPDNPYADYTVSQLYEYVSNFELSRDIDSRWQYSNTAYALLGHILELVAKTDFNTLVEKHICEPLHMNSTMFSPTRELRRNMALGHTEYGKPANEMDFLLAGGGGLRSNVNDMLTFAAANLGLIKTDLLPAMELSHVKQAVKDGNDSYVTMGWTLWNENGKHLLFKDGGTFGYRTFLGINKKTMTGVVVLSNCNNTVTDIGLHILDGMHNIEPYRYPWNLLDTLRTTVKTNGVAAAIELYRQLKVSNNQAMVFDERQLNYLGNELRRNKKIKDAIKIYELNLQEYPKSTLVYESLGETYKRNKNKRTAIPYFEKARELDPKNPHWDYILNKLRNS